MTTQEILARVHDALAPYAVIANAQDSRSYNAECVAHEMHERLRILAADLEDQTRMEIAAKRGTLSAVKAVKGMMKNAAKRNETLGYAWVDADGRQCSCDGFRAYRLNADHHLPLEPRPEDAGEPIDLDKIFPRTPADNPAFALALPTAQELNAHIAVKRAQWSGKRADFSCAWDFGHGKPQVNADYLLDVLAVMGDDVKAFAIPRTGEMNAHCAIWFTSERGDAMLLPIRKGDDQQTDEERAAAKAEDAAALAEARRNNNARMLAQRLHDYQFRAEREPDYAMTPDEFAWLAELVDDSAA